MKRLLALTVTAVSLAVAPMGLAQEKENTKTLSIGDKAPPIAIAKFYRGEPVTAFEPGTAYVMEFWATWCGPCIAQIPHLAKVQKTFKDKNVRVVSTAIWQREEPVSKRIEHVGEFVEKQGDKMAYTVAIQDGEKMAKAWMEPAGQNGIPSAFLVGRDGHIEWIGHPAAIDPVLEQYVAGTWNREEARAAFAAEQKWNIEGREYMMKIFRAQQAGDHAKAVELLEEAAAKFPDVDQLDQMAFTVMLADKSTCDKAYALGRKLMEASWDQAQALNSLAWTVVDDSDVAHRDLDFAMKAAKRADELTDHADASILDTLARVYWEQGDSAKAITVQTEAVKHADGRMKAQIEEVLERYKKEANSG